MPADTNPISARDSASTSQPDPPRSSKPALAPVGTDRHNGASSRSIAAQPLLRRAIVFGRLPGCCASPSGAALVGVGLSRATHAASEFTGRARCAGKDHSRRLPEPAGTCSAARTRNRLPALPGQVVATGIRSHSRHWSMPPTVGDSTKQDRGHREPRQNHCRRPEVNAIPASLRSSARHPKRFRLAPS